MKLSFFFVLVLLVGGCAELAPAVKVAENVLEIARTLCLLDHAKAENVRADVVQDACQTVEQLTPYLDQAKRMQSAPREMAVCK